MLRAAVCIVCLICLFVCFLFICWWSSCSSIIEPPDYSQPPGFGGTTQVSQRNTHAVWLIAFKSLSKYEFSTDWTVVLNTWHCFSRGKDRPGTTAPWRQGGRGWRLILRIWSSATSPTKCLASQVLILQRMVASFAHSYTHTTAICLETSVVR